MNVHCLYYRGGQLFDLAIFNMAGNEIEYPELVQSDCEDVPYVDLVSDSEDVASIDSDTALEKELGLKSWTVKLTKAKAYGKQPFGQRTNGELGYGRDWDYVQRSGLILRTCCSIFLCYF